MAVVNELITKFSFIGNLRPQQDFNANLRASIGLLGGLTIALKAAAVAVVAMSNNQLRALNPLIKLRNETGISTVRLQQLEQMAISTGSSFDAMASTLTGLNDKIADAAYNGSETFARLGISIRGVNGQLKNADQVLFEIASRFNQMGLSRQQRQFFASQLGIDQSLIKFLNMSTAEYKEFNKQASKALFLTDAQLKAAEKYNIQLDLMQLNLNSLRNQIAVALAPELTELVGKFNDLIDRNRDWIVNGIVKTVTFIGKLTDAIIRVAPVIIAIGAAFTAARVAALGFGVVFGAVLSPVVLITAGIAALFLIIDDLIVAFNGGKSVIRDFFQEFFGVDITPIMRGIVDNVLAGFAIISNALAPLADLFGQTFSLIGNLLTGNFEGAIDDVEAMFYSLAEFIKRSFTIIFEGLKSLAQAIFPDWVLNGFSNFSSGVSAGTDFLFGNGSDQLSMPFPSSPFSGAGTGSITQSNNISVYSADPLRAGQVTADRLQNQLSDFEAVLGRGGR